MDNYYICHTPNPCQWKGPVHIVPVGKESFTGNWKSQYFPKAKYEQIITFRVFEEPIPLPDGALMHYHWELASSQGASFTLFVEPQHTREHVHLAKEWLRKKSDVVSIYAFRVTGLKQ